MFVPSKVFFTKGVGRHREQLTSFELSLRDAGIEKYNLVQVSSIFPPKCRIINREAGLKELTPGEIAFVVMSKCQSDEPRRLVAASVGCALPSDRSVYGYLSEHHDEEKSWDEKKEVWKISGKIFRSFNITQSAIVKDDYTTVIAAAVFVL
jgi:arginine decarboxylase